MKIFRFFSLDIHGSIVQLAIFLILFSVGWILENYFSSSKQYLKWRHAFFNLKLFIVDALPQILLGVLFIKIMGWTDRHQFGIINWLLPQNKTLTFVAGFILLDLGEYIYHVTMHKAKRLWLIHAIHHSDTQVDVSTVFREHPAETIIRNCFALFWIFLLGAAPWLFFIHLAIQTFFVLFSHMNVWLPDKLNTVISFIFITPNLHRVHHHYKQPYTDSNYGDILSIWDRLFGTLCILPKEQIIFGIDYMENHTNIDSTIFLLGSPFRKKCDGLQNKG